MCKGYRGGMSVNILTHTYADGHKRTRRPRDAKHMRKYINTHPRSYTDTHTPSRLKSLKREWFVRILRAQLIKNFLENVI